MTFERLKAMTETPNYLKKILDLQAKGHFIKPGYSNIQIRHDDWCALLKHKGVCNCDPDVEVIEENYLGEKK